MATIGTLRIDENDTNDRIHRKKKFENIVGKGENAGDQNFLLFPTMFSQAFLFCIPL